VLIEEYAVFKLYRRLHSGINPEVEMARFLTEEAGFGATPPLLGTIELVAAEDAPMAFGVLAGFVRNQGDAWGWAQDYLMRAFDSAVLVQAAAIQPPAPVPDGAPEVEDPHGFFMTLVETLGRRTAELHRALCPAETPDPAFQPEPIVAGDLTEWRDKIIADIDATLAALGERMRAQPPLDPVAYAMADEVLGSRETILARILAATARPIAAMKTRFHGDYHLGQVLLVRNDFIIIDFEGEPRRSLEERRRKHSPLRDVAGMVRSFAYAAAAALREGVELRPASRELLERFVADWARRSIGAFLDGYRRTITGCASYPDRDQSAQDLLDLFILEKAFYEIGYELANRPAWVTIPLAGVLELIRPPTEEISDAPRE
jgi:maltose alpha-D-glucosyltransferase/alpha-amylase